MWSRVGGWLGWSSGCLTTAPGTMSEVVGDILGGDRHGSPHLTQHLFWRRGPHEQLACVRGGCRRVSNGGSGKRALLARVMRQRERRNRRGRGLPRPTPLSQYQHLEHAALPLVKRRGRPHRAALTLWHHAGSSRVRAKTCGGLWFSLGGLRRLVEARSKVGLGAAHRRG